MDDFVTTPFYPSRKSFYFFLLIQTYVMSNNSNQKNNRPNITKGKEKVPQNKKKVGYIRNNVTPFILLKALSNFILLALSWKSNSIQRKRTHILRCVALQLLTDNLWKIMEIELQKIIFLTNFAKIFVKFYILSKILLQTSSKWC